MQLATGTVVGGKIVVDGDPCPGCRRHYSTREVDDTFECRRAKRILESIAQTDRGETISADELLERLRRIA